MSDEASSAARRAEELRPTDIEGRADIDRNSERTVDVAGHACRRIAVETGTSVLSKFECVDCGVHTNSVLTFDQVDCETGEWDRSADAEETESDRPDMRVHRDVEAILEDLESTENVVGVEKSPEGREHVDCLFVRLGGDLPATRDLNGVCRDHDLLISGAYLSPTGNLKVQLVCPEVSRFAA